MDAEDIKLLDVCIETTYKVESQKRPMSECIQLGVRFDQVRQKLQALLTKPDAAKPEPVPLKKVD